MSTELYIQGLSANGQAGLPVSTVLGAFDDVSKPDDFGFYRLNFGAESYVDLGLEVFDGIVVYATAVRPINHDEFWSGVYGLLVEGPYVAYMPGSRVVAGSINLQSAMPVDMFESLGELVVVHSAVEMRDVLIA